MTAARAAIVTLAVLAGAVAALAPLNYSALFYSDTDAPTSAVSEQPVAIGPDGSPVVLPRTVQPDQGGDAILGVRPDVPAWGWAIIIGAAMLAGLCVVFYWLAGTDDSGRLGP